ncbi:MAG: RNA methyltransferase substrate-binding domain-containing protein, partial [Brevinematia bacterium]
MIFFGINPTLEVLNSKHLRNIKEIIIDKAKENPRIETITGLASKSGVKVRFVDRPVLNNITKTSSHQGVAFD